MANRLCVKKTLGTTGLFTIFLNPLKTVSGIIDNFMSFFKSNTTKDYNKPTDVKNVT